MPVRCSMVTWEGWAWLCTKGPRWMLPPGLQRLQRITVFGSQHHQQHQQEQEQLNSSHPKFSTQLKWRMGKSTLHPCTTELVLWSARQLRVSATLTSSQHLRQEQLWVQRWLGWRKSLMLLWNWMQNSLLFYFRAWVWGQMYTNGYKAMMTNQNCKHKVHCIMCNWDSLASLGNVFGVCNTSWENDEIGRP